MGRHSAPDDEPADGGADAPRGAIAVQQLLARAEPHVVIRPRTRHTSEPQDQLAEAPTTALPVLDVAEAPTEALPNLTAVAQAPTEALPVVAAPGAAPGTEAGEAGTDAAPTPRQTRDGGTRADLRLLRAERVLRAQCLAALLLPFLVYTVVLLVIGRTDLYLIAIAAPTVAAGVSIGALLDRAHAARRRAGEAEAAAPVADTTDAPEPVGAATDPVADTTDAPDPVADTTDAPRTDG